MHKNIHVRPLRAVRENPVRIFRTIGTGRSWLLKKLIVALGQRAQVQRPLCDVTKTPRPVTKTLSNNTILSYLDVDTSVLPLFLRRPFLCTWLERDASDPAWWV